MREYRGAQLRITMGNDMRQENDSCLHNNRINTDWQFRYAPLPAGYAERWAFKDSS